jgi:hypothetical protein
MTSYKIITLKLTFICGFPRTILDKKMRSHLGHQSKKEHLLALFTLVAVMLAGKLDDT